MEMDGNETEPAGIPRTHKQLRRILVFLLDSLGEPR